MGEWKAKIGRAASPFAAARGIGLNSRFSPQSFLAFATGRFGGSEFWRGADFVAQQKMLPCATWLWVVAQGGWWGVVSSKERSAHLSSERCALFWYEIRYKTQFLHICPPLKSQRLYLYAYADFDIILHIN